ncbi:MAG: amphi-Trp domain-containing protein [Candidatus Nanohaloarchaea archaeon]|jgi:amphi-Trp domain-containing protein
MASEEVELDFEFSNDELANFLDNFADKLREGEVGLSFKGREEVQITPNKDNRVELEFKEGDTYKKLSVELELRQEMQSTDEGRRKINVKVV